MDRAGLSASVSITGPAARREFAPARANGGFRHRGRSPAAEIGFKEANANHIPNTNPKIIS
jgi:hypothetical protein